MMTHTPAPSAWAARMIRNTRNLALWTAAWVASLALAKFGPGTLWTEHTATTVVAVLFNLLIGLGLLIANKRHLQALDELQRAVQLHAMAWALGAGLIGGMTWTLLQGHDLIGFEARIPHLIMLMAVTYLAGIILGSRRYQ